VKISIITLFPEMFTGPFDASIIKRARTQEKIQIEYIQLRDFASDHYKSVDDHPYGGGTGMILRVDVVDRAIAYAASTMSTNAQKIISLDPQGTPYTQTIAKSLSAIEHIIVLCAHYEGVDERIRDLVDMEISIGDYVLTGGEIPAMAIIDSIVRLIPGVLSKSNATTHESFEEGLLEYPQYTRPDIYKNTPVPAILLSGNHKDIATWRKQEAIIRTKKRRPDLH